MAEVDLFVEFGREAPPGFSIVIEGSVYLVRMSVHSMCNKHILTAVADNATMGIGTSGSSDPSRDDSQSVRKSSPSL